MPLCCFLAHIMSYGGLSPSVIRFYLCQASSHFVSYIRVYLLFDCLKNRTDLESIELNHFPQN